VKIKANAYGTLIIYKLYMFHCAMGKKLVNSGLGVKTFKVREMYKVK